MGTFMLDDYSDKHKGTSRAPERLIPGYTTLAQVPSQDIEYEHEDYRPSFPDVQWPPLEEVPYTDKGILEDARCKHLLKHVTDVFNYTIKIGTEISRVLLKDLTDIQKNDLAMLITT